MDHTKVMSDASKQQDQATRVGGINHALLVQMPGDVHSLILSSYEIVAI